jgi:hypothetical protein
MTDEAARVFQLFAKDTRDVWKSHEDMRTRMELIQPLLKHLVSDATLRAARGGDARSAHPPASAKY